VTKLASRYGCSRPSSDSHRGYGNLAASAVTTGRCTAASAACRIFSNQIRAGVDFRARRKERHCCEFRNSNSSWPRTGFMPQHPAIYRIFKWRPRNGFVTNCCGETATTSGAQNAAALLGQKDCSCAPVPEYLPGHALPESSFSAEAP